MSTCINRVILIGFLTILPCVLGQSQTKAPSLKMGGHEIALGMPADRALADLRVYFKVERAEDLPFHKDAVSWAVSSREGGPRFGCVNAIGSAVVGAEYLLFGRKLDSAKDIASALIEASSTLEEQHQNNCLMRVLHGYAPDGEIKTGILLSCGSYVISLRKSRGLGKGEEMKYEVWEGIGAIE